MDVGAPSNWVRIEHLLQHHPRMRGAITASATPSRRIVEVQRERALAAAEDDWANDSHGTGVLGKQPFLDALKEAGLDLEAD